MQLYIRRQMGARRHILTGTFDSYRASMSCALVRSTVHEDLQESLWACNNDCQDGGAARCGLMLGEADLIMLP